MGLKRGLAKRIREGFGDEGLGKAGSALALAMLTVLAATVAGLEGQASLEAQRGKRISEQIALQATGADTSAVIQVGAAYGTYRRWHEELELSAWASYEQIRRTDEGGKALLDAFQRAGADIAGWVQAQSPFLQPPYYDPELGFSDSAAYEAVTIVGPSVEAAERRANELAVAVAWDGKASEYVTILTIVAVGLFFVGLSSTVSAGRRFLAGAGVAFGLAGAVWTIAVTVQPIHRVPDAAIEHYVAGQVALAHAPFLGGAGPDDEIDHGPYETALAEVDEVIRLDPDYVAAYQLRGGVRVHYADELTISGVESDADAEALLRDGMADFRRYLEARPDDYAAWWNLGWAAYLLGDYAVSIEATDRALELAPEQFTLYLNRALAVIGLGDRSGATADVDRALVLAATDTSDTASWYLGQSDLDIGRLAELRPEVADFLGETQLRLREAQVALRVLGTPQPDSAAPELGLVSVRPIEVGHYASGRITEGAALGRGAHVDSPDAVGVRVTVDGAGIEDRNLSARVWINGLPHPEYVTDVVASGPFMTLDLVSPYGRAGFDLPAGAYEMELYVDGSRRFEFDWIVDPRPAQPAFTLTASGARSQLVDDGFTCPEGASVTGGTETTCSLPGSRDREYFVLLRWDAEDRLTYLALTARTNDETDDIADVAPLLFTYTIRLLYPPELVPRAVAWVDEQGEAVNDLETGGTTIRVYGATGNVRQLDISAPWP